MSWDADLRGELLETFADLTPRAWELVEDHRAAVRERWRLDARERRRAAGAKQRPHVWIENRKPKPPKVPRRRLTLEEKRARAAALQRRRRRELGEEHRAADREYHRVWRERRRELEAAQAAAASVPSNRGCCVQCREPAFRLVQVIGGGICHACVCRLGVAS